MRLSAHLPAQAAHQQPCLCPKKFDVDGSSQAHQMKTHFHLNTPSLLVLLLEDVTKLQGHLSCHSVISLKSFLLRATAERDQHKVNS